jgi:hypothetical protein
LSSADSAQPDDAPLGYRCRRRADGKGMRCSKGNRVVSWRWYYSENAR